MAKRIVQAGDKFGRLTVLKPAEHTEWFCRCDCGVITKIPQRKLWSGNTKSCGCLRGDRAAERSRTHGLTGSTEHTVWSGMKGRCYDPSHVGYARYGGAGIVICERWLGKDGFLNFLADMGHRPSRNHTIDRKDGNGSYSPENCRWATREEQMRNTVRNRLLTHNGETMCLADWAKRLEAYPTTISKRLAAGWTVERALTTPARKFSGKRGDCGFSQRDES